jgi:hypothetical protein
VCLRVSSDWIGDKANHELVHANEFDKNSVLVESHIEASHEAQPFFVAESVGEAWGLATRKSDALYDVKLKDAIAGAILTKCCARQLKLHMILVSGIYFVHTALGMQTCSATNACY